MKKLLLVLLAAAAACLGQTKMNQLVYGSSAWDPFTTNPQYQPLIAKQLVGFVTFSPFFDAQLSWFKAPAYAYLDSYAIYTDPTRNSAVVNSHPEWILRDAAGNKLYIPWGCTAATATSPASCPQYAADVGNKQFVAFMSGAALQFAAAGYDLVFDDVNMTLDRVSDVGGNKTAPVDPRTGVPMTESAWENYFGAYLSAARAAVQTVVPTFRIMHNAIWWYDAVSSPGIDQEIKAADVVWYERGFGDAGLTGGTGQWSLWTMMSTVDRVHSLGSHAGFGEFSAATTFLYSTACYFAVTDGVDTIGFTDLTPDKWDASTLRLMNVDLGAPLGARYRKYGVIERDFSKGYVLVVEPGGGSLSLIPDRPVADAYTGQQVSKISLASGQGGVYLYQ